LSQQLPKKSDGKKLEVKALPGQEYGTNWRVKSIRKQKRT
jgi:hypothetical protein